MPLLTFSLPIPKTVFRFPATFLHFAIFAASSPFSISAHIFPFCRSIAWRNGTTLLLRLDIGHPYHFCQRLFPIFNLLGFTFDRQGAKPQSESNRNRIGIVSESIRNRIGTESNGLKNIHSHGIIYIVYFIINIDPILNLFKLSNTHSIQCPFRVIFISNLTFSQIDYHRLVDNVSYTTPSHIQSLPRSSLLIQCYIHYDPPQIK